MTAQTTWPEGVIARYLTVGGATVDITATATPPRVTGKPGVMPIGNGLAVAIAPNRVIDLTVTAQCHGCGTTDETEHNAVRPYVLGGLMNYAEGREARDWAQSHAETCRAMPRPEAVS